MLENAAKSKELQLEYLQMPTKSDSNRFQKSSDGVDLKGGEYPQKHLPCASSDYLLASTNAHVA